MNQKYVAIIRAGGDQGSGRRQQKRWKGAFQRHVGGRMVGILQWCLPGLPSYDLGSLAPSSYRLEPSKKGWGVHQPQPTLRVGNTATNLDFIVPLVNSASADRLWVMTFLFTPHCLPGYVGLVLTTDLQPNSPAQPHILLWGQKPCPELQTAWLGSWHCACLSQPSLPGGWVCSLSSPLPV